MMILSAPAAPEAVLYSRALGPFTHTNDYSLGGYTVIGKYAPNLLTAGGSSVRLLLRGPIGAGHTCSIDNVTISLVANSASSDLHDSAASPTAITFSGGASVTLGRNGQALSDKITFTVDRTRALLIAFNITSGTQWVPFTGGLNAKFYNHYVRAATAQAATANRTTAYTAGSGFSPLLAALQVSSN